MEVNIMSTSKNEANFYEAMWFSEEVVDIEPVVRGYDIDAVIEKLLNITQEGSGSVEVYKITSNNKRHMAELYRSFKVINELELYDEVFGEC